MRQTGARKGVLWMAVKVESPDPEILDGIDLQLFGVFDVKSEESIQAASAQAYEAPGDDGTGEAQEETAGDQEQVSHQAQETGSEEGDEPNEDANQTEEAQASKAPSEEQWVVPGKFRTWDDVLRAQQNAEKQLGRLHREIAEMRRRGASQSEIDAQQEKIQTEEERAKLSKELLREFLKDPIAYNEKLKQEIIQAQIEAAQRQRQIQEERLRTVNEGIGIVAGKYPDFAQMQDSVEKVIAEEPAFQRILQTLQNDPHATSADFASLVDAAYRVARSTNASAALQAARVQGQKEAQQNAQSRQAARVAGQSVRRDQTEESVDDQIRREIKEAGGTRSMWRL